MVGKHPCKVDLVTKDRVKNGQVIAADQTLSVDLIVVKMTDFNVILGMDWLASYRASIDCRKKKKKKKKVSPTNLMAQVLGLPER